MKAKGVLTRLSLAWSRDGEEKFYVQDRMREVGRDLWSWLADGAHVYVCGDAKRMAKDVERALVDIVAQHGARSHRSGDRLRGGAEEAGPLSAGCVLMCAGAALFPSPRLSGERVASACEPGEGQLPTPIPPHPARFARGLSPQAGRGENGRSAKKNISPASASLARIGTKSAYLSMTEEWFSYFRHLLPLKRK